MASGNDREGPKPIDEAAFLSSTWSVINEPFETCDGFKHAVLSITYAILFNIQYMCAGRESLPCGTFPMRSVEQVHPVALPALTARYARRLD